MKKQLTIIGAGNQGKAWAQNLKDSGWEVQFALRKPEKHTEFLKKYGFQAIQVTQSDQFFRHIAILIPDDQHQRFLQETKLKKETVVIYAHGYSMVEHHFNQLYPDYSHLLFAPKAIARELRENYLNGGLLGAFHSFEYSQDGPQDKKFLDIMAVDLGINKGPYRCRFKEETLSDLFSEQALLCGALPALSELCFKKLTDKGMPKELAWFECFYELKLIANALVDLGPEEFFKLISPNALIGAKEGERIFRSQALEDKLENLWSNIEDMKFFQKVKQSNFSQVKSHMLCHWKESPLQETFDLINNGHEKASNPNHSKR